MKTPLISIPLLIALAPLLPLIACEPADPPPADAPGPADAHHATPEDALRSLLLGMVERDEQTIRNAILPAEHAEALWEGDPPSPETLEAYQQMLLDEQRTQIHRLEPGDTVPLPGGREHELTEDVLSEDRQLLVVEREGRPILAPVWVERTDGSWRVDAGPIIAAQLLRQHPPAPPNEPRP